MVSNDIDKLIKQREKKRKKGNKQYLFGIAIIVTVLILFSVLLTKQYVYAVCLGIGTIIGIVLRYSRFCFVAAFRDPFITGNTKVFRGIILAMIISTIGFAVIQSKHIRDYGIDYNLIPGEISSVGFHVIIGSFMFGIGMVLAGGCASGVLMRIGEGYAVHWIVLIGFMIGTLLGAKSYPFWFENFIKNAKTVYFSEYLDIKIVTVLQIIVLLILYALSSRYQKKRYGK